MVENKKPTLVEITREEFENYLELQLEEAKNYFEKVLKVYQRYLKDRTNSDYYLRYFKTDTSAYYTKHRKQWGFINNEE